VRALKGVSEFSSLQRRRATVLTLQTEENNGVSYFLSFFYVSAFLCFSPAYILVVSFFSPSSPFFSQTVLFIRPLSFNR
jgi:hypothetical protein